MFHWWRSRLKKKSFSSWFHQKKMQLLPPLKQLSFFTDVIDPSCCFPQLLYRDSSYIIYLLSFFFNVIAHSEITHYGSKINCKWHFMSIWKFSCVNTFAPMMKDRQCQLICWSWRQTGIWSENKIPPQSLTPAQRLNKAADNSLRNILENTDK